MYNQRFNQKIWQSYWPLLFLALALPIITQAEIAEFSLNSQDVIEQLSCYQDEDKILQLKIKDKIYLIEFIDLITTPIINSRVTCQKFIQALPGYLAKEKVNLDLVLESTKKSGYYQPLNSNLVKYCADLNLCSRNFIDLLIKKSKYRECQINRDWQELLELWKPAIQKSHYKVIESLDLEIFPFVPFNEKLLEYSGGGNIYASTMTLGQKTVRRYFKKLQENPESKDKVFILHDAGLIFSKNEYHLLNSYFSQKSALYSLPLTSGRYFDTIHHWKFLYNDKDKRSSLSSMNLNTPEKTDLIDAIYNFNNKNIKEELQHHFQSLVNLQCKNSQDLACLSKVATRGSYEHNSIKKVIARTCQSLVKENKYRDQGYLLEPDKTDLEYLVSKLIDEAEREIIIISHKFKLEGLYRELLKKRDSGISVKVFVTSPPPFTKPDDKIVYVSSSGQRVRHIPDPHLKVMLIDRKKLWFGTGNFTYNAFNKASELYGITNDQESINRILQVAEVLASGFSKTIRNIFNAQKPKDNWLYIDEKIIEEGKPYLNKVNKYWLNKYMKFNSKAKPLLSKCQLDHLLILNAKDFNLCLKSNKTN